jgi:NADPH:quinone reductase
MVVMRAIQVREFGGPEVLVPAEIPEPVAGPGQIVVGLAVGGGVDPGWIGRHVAARTSAGYAERIAAAVEDVVHVPEQLGSAEAAAVLHDGVTALRPARLAKIGGGEWVLVTAAAGGAGSLLVQMVREAGARVVAAARGERKLALARELGAEVTVDYSERGWQHRVREAVGGGGGDIAFDGAGGESGEASFEAVAQGGRFLTYGTSGGVNARVGPRAAEQRQVRVTNVLEAGPPDKATVRELLMEALASAAQGRIRPVIGSTYPLERARDAHASLAERTTVGKSLLLV